MYRLAAIVLLLVCILSAETSPDSSAHLYLDKSTTFLTDNQIDSAIYYLDLSRNAGLSKDSFLYQYANIYLEKGVLDTALAFNYSLKPEKTSPLYQSKFEQRYLIYSLLGLKDEAVKAFDSLGIGTQSVQKKSISFPELILSVGETYKQSIEKTPVTDSVTRLQTMKDTANNGFGTDVDASIQWSIPWSGRQRFTIGTSYTNTESANHKADSLAHSWSAFLTINNLGPFSANYTFSRDKSLSQTLSSSNSFNLSLIIPDSSFKKIGGFSLKGKFTLSHSELTQQIYSMFAFFDTKLTRHYSLNVNLMFLTIFIDKTIINYPPLPVSNMSGSDFLGTNNRIITKPDSLTDLYIRRIIQAQRDTTILLLQIPNSNISLSPSFDNTFSIFWKISLMVSLGYSLSFYTDDYIWYIAKDPDIALARDIATGMLYNINSLDVSGISIDTLERREYRKRRIDNALQIGITLSRPVWRIGDFSLSGTYEKVFSNMVGFAPVSIPVRSFECSAVLSINIPLRK
jgi:hypothetical protein